MAEFYGQRVKAYQYLDRILKQSKKDNVTISVNNLIFEMTGVFAVSKTALKERLKEYEERDNTLKLEW